MADENVNQQKERLSTAVYGEAIRTLRDTIKSHKDMNFQTDDEFLLRFLRAELFDQNKTFDLIKQYYKQRIEYSGFFKKLSASNLAETFKHNFHGSLPGRDNHGRCILIYNSLACWNPRDFPLEDINSMTLLTLEKLAQNPDAQTNGLVVVKDFSCMTFSHLRAVSPSSLKQIFKTCVDNFPLRYKQIHVVNENWIFPLAFSLMKPFLYRDLKTLFMFHGRNYESLHRYINPNLLPKEFGGALDTYTSSEWYTKLLENDVNLRESMKYGFVPEE